MDKAFITIVVERNQFRKIFIEDIFYLKANRSYSVIKTIDAEHTMSKPLKEFEHILDFDEFVKVNRSFIVNTNKCIGLKSGKNRQLLLVNNEVIKPNNECLEILRKLFHIKSLN